MPIFKVRRDTKPKDPPVLIYTVSIGSNQDPWQQTYRERQAAKTVLHLRQTLPAENVQKLNPRVSVSLVSKPTKGFARFEATCAKKAHRATKLAEEALHLGNGHEFLQGAGGL